ncbi:hypothetical protein [Thermoflavimicrobium dichotomicum]|uniref:hypothetical protein n=1 Tax=Thermoflavimicrobium dichotomicum TaxID=46223 RepID=UPI0015879033|nr:hypothetical protein [Thermoflavimicrobium dichotomicum]
MREAYLSDAVRILFGKRDGGLKEIQHIRHHFQGKECKGWKSKRVWWLSLVVHLD